MSRRKTEKQEVTAETQLAPQLGADYKKIARGEWDARIQSKLPSPIVAICGSYFCMLPDEEGGEFARGFFDNLYRTLVSVDGWNVNKQVQMVGASKGQPTIGELRKKPGWLGRNLTQRDWQRQADEEGQTVVE